MGDSKEIAVASFSPKERRTIIVATTLGNVLEWYEIYLYVYWSPIISKLFFRSGSNLENLIDTFWIFGLGLLARPIGGIFFGRLGDLIGRRKVLILSVSVMTIPTFVTGLLPTYAQIGELAPWILAGLRICQAFPAGAELPGASCYLYESSRFSERKYATSWAAVGFQLGILISTIECLLLEQLLTQEQLLTWGWRLSFWVGGCIGVLGLMMRSRLHESPLFHEMTKSMKVNREPIADLFKHKLGLTQGFFFSLLCSSFFYLFTINFPIYFGKYFSFSYKDSLILLSIMLILITVPLPLFGKLAQRKNYKNMLIYSTAGMLLLLFPMYIGFTTRSITLIIPTIILFCIAYSCMTSLLPYITCNLFPTRSRFTCLSTSFNAVDSIVGGFTPVLTLYLLNMTGDAGSFCWIILIFGILSFMSFTTIREKKHPN